MVQLLLAMSFASDRAVDQLRATEDLTDAVLSCSSYAKTERLRRRWIKYPIEVLKRKLRGSEEGGAENSEDPFLTAASVNQGLTGQIQGTANQVLAAIGHNVWYPKSPGQKGLRILCLDGGGTRVSQAYMSWVKCISTMNCVNQRLLTSTRRE